MFRAGKTPGFASKVTESTDPVFGPGSPAVFVPWPIPQCCNPPFLIRWVGTYGCGRGVKNAHGCLVEGVVDTADFLIERSDSGSGTVPPSGRHVSVTRLSDTPAPRLKIRQTCPACLAAPPQATTVATCVWTEGVSGVRRSGTHHSRSSAALQLPAADVIAFQFDAFRRV